MLYELVTMVICQIIYMLIGVRVYIHMLVKRVKNLIPYSTSVVLWPMSLLIWSTELMKSEKLSHIENSSVSQAHLEDNAIVLMTKSP